VEARFRSLIPFFLLSCGLHLLLFLALSRRLPDKDPFSSSIPVALLPAPPGEKTGLREESRLRKSLRPTPKSLKRAAPSNRTGASEVAKSKTNPQTALAKEPVQEAFAREERGIIQPSLPTIKELLPPITWSRQTDGVTEGEGAVPLNSREPRYVSYLTSVKRAIELVWEYPEAALRRGIEGKLVLEFTIAVNGGLSEAVLVQSSGSGVLDQEALRAVRAASPFHPIPSWVGKNPLHIVASFEYYDHRVKYGPLR